MSAFRSIASQWTVNVKDITDALKAGTVNVKEAAALLERVKLVDTVEDSPKQLLIDGLGPQTTDESPIEPNSYDGLKDQLSAPEHIEQYYELMNIRGLS